VSSTERSLILGAYSDLSLQYLEPFVRSLRATEFKGSLCIVAGRFSEQEREHLALHADAVVHVDAEYSNGLQPARKFLSMLRGTRGFRRAYAPAFQLVARATYARRAFERWSNLEFHLEGLQALRYMHYHRYLIEQAPMADLVMITDLRDVVFQNDPFENPVRGLEVYLEDDSVRIGREPFNTRWIQDLYGQAGLREMSGHQVSCSGVVVGTREDMLAYLGEMMSQIARQRRPMGSHDQGVHNMLIHRGRLSGATSIQNGYGRVLTLGAMGEFETNSSGAIINADGSIPAVLHQWDRHESLVQRILRIDDPSSSTTAGGGDGR
jgi:hypothetical protein